MNRPPIAPARRLGVVAVLMFVALVVTVIVVNAVRSIRPVGPQPTPAQAPRAHSVDDRPPAVAATEAAAANATYAEFLRQEALDAARAAAATPVPEPPKPKPEDLRPARRALADLLETGMLAQGLDAHVKVVGQQLSIEHILVNRPYVYREINDRDFVASLRTVGFKSIRFSNGYDYTVTWAIPRD